MFQASSIVKMHDIRPNHTIYINNLNEKVKKEGEINLQLNSRSRYVDELEFMKMVAERG